MKHFFLCCIVLFAAASSHAQPGVLDPTFGRKGIARGDLGTHFTYSSSASQVLPGPSGRIYIVLSSGAAGTIVSRRYSNGTIDSTYGYDGFSRNVFFASVFAAFQPDGKMVLAGTGGRNPSGIVRLNADGKIDLGFGNKGIQDIGFIPAAIAVQANGKLVVAGVTASDEGFVLARYNTDGSADNTFNGGVQQITTFTYEEALQEGGSITHVSGTAYAIAIQPDGKIVVAGSGLTDFYSGNKFALARYNDDGSPDNTFDGDGKLLTSFEASGQVLNTIGYSVAIQKDLKIVLGGSASRADGTGYDFAVARYNADGSPDNDFDADGQQTIPVGTGYSSPNSLAIQADGKIVIGGFGPDINGSNDFFVARCNTDGSPDNGFDGDGILSTDIQTSDDYAGSLAVLSTGKIVIAGYSYVGANSLFSLAKYNTDGSPDITFDGDGKLLDKDCHCNTQFFASVVQPDGKLVAAGKTWNGNNFDFAIERFNTDGSIDSTFSDDGKQMTNFANDDEIRSIVLQPDGKIVAAGNINYSQAIGIFRYTADGKRDVTFGKNGTIVTSFGVADICGSVSLQADGKIVLSGYTVLDPNTGDPLFLVARYNSDGTTDNTFGDNGRQVTGFGNDNKGVGRASAVQSDGKIVVVGRSYIDGQDNIALARFNINGTLDDSFSGDGKQNSVFGSSDYFAESVVIQPDGKIVVGGYSQNISGHPSAFIVARYNTDGEPDNAFGNNGFVETDLGAYNYNFGISVALGPNGKIAIGGTNDNFAIAMYNANGTPDYTYNLGGTGSTEVGLAGSTIHSLVFGGGYLYATGYAAFPHSSGVVARYLLTNFGPLPVSLLDFKGSLRNKKAILEWKTENEAGLASFEVQRSAANRDFKPIASVNSKGSSSQQYTYSLIDEAPLSGTNFYRLKLVDKDGKYTYSKTVTVNNKGQLIALNISPNPVADILFVKAGVETGTATVAIIDAAGRKMMEKRVVLNAESASPVSVAALPNGVYSLQVITATEKETVKFIKY